jgi:hypothetical protein
MMNMEQLIRTVILKSIGTARKRKSLRSLLDKGIYLLDKGAAQNLISEPNLQDGLSWRELDRVYSFCRRQLYSQAAWRYGPARVYEVAKEGFEAISQYTSFLNKVYCDLGCGTYHPYGVAAAMFLNGSRSTISLDLQDSNKQRAAEALADLLCDCFFCSDRWNWNCVDTSDYLSRLQRFDLLALQQGRLDDGLAGLPMRHIVTDIHDPILEEGSIDLMTSRAVLEHFLDFDIAVDRFFALMGEGGIACHHIDLVDHRAYANSDYHRWSFLAENENWSDGLVNRLRSNEVKTSFERAGFEILRWENRIGEMPEGFMKQIAGRFREMTEEELSATGVFCVLRKP